jgi:DNA-binding SARP family transcriptional activator
VGLTAHERILTERLPRGTMQERRPGTGVLRESLLRRLERISPQLLALIAPAGFGKSTVVRQYLREDARVGVCDCTGVRDDLDLARRFVPALADALPERATALTQCELMLGDGGTSVAERVGLAVEAWKEPVEPCTIVFENAEHLIGSPSARDLFTRLLAQRPHARRAFVCSREPLHVHLIRFASPHEVVVLRPADLAFDRDEVRAIFSGDLDDATLDRIVTVSQGWPIAILLVKRFAAEGRLEALLDRLGDVAFGELHDYLVDEVLSSMDGRTVEALFAVAAIPRATPSEVAAAVGDPDAATILSDLQKESPFLVRFPDGSLAVHPLLGSLLLEHREEKRAALLAALGQTYEQSHQFVRAAELHLARGDRAGAAASLGRHEVLADPTPSMEYARVLASLDASLVRRYPRLWGVTALLRMFCAGSEQMLDDAQSLWRTLPPETTTTERYYIFVFRVLCMSYLGMLYEALEMVNAFAKEHAIGDVPHSVFDAQVLYLRGLLLARRGDLGDAEQYLTAVLPLVASMDVMSSGTLLALGADIARVRGQRALERSFIDRALDHARASVLTNFVAFDLAEAVFGAWFAGEDEAMALYAAELEALVERLGLHGFAYFSAASRGRDAQPKDTDLLKYVALGRLIACANAQDRAEAALLANSALAVAVQYRAPFVEAIAAVAAGLVEPEGSAQMFARAAEYAQQCESPELRAAVDAIASGAGSSGMLAVFAKKLVRARVQRVPLLEFELIAGNVRCEGRSVTLIGRELELLTVLGLRREAISRARLIDTLWPDLEEYAARNALSVCLHRLRAHLGNETAIVRNGESYRLADDAWVDLWEIERLVASTRTGELSNAAQRTSLQKAHALLGSARERPLEAECFAPTGRRLDELALEVTMRLADRMLREGDAAQALQLAHQMIAYDPCDEPAREIAIRAYLDLGDRAAALRQYRQYRQTLRAELQCEPSPALGALVATSA